MSLSSWIRGEGADIMAKMERPYSRVYWEAPDDEKFRNVWSDDRALSWWLRLLLLSDQAYPNLVYVPAPIPRATLKILTDARLVKVLPDGRYRITGLEAERERRSISGRNAAEARWGSDRDTPASEEEIRPHMRAHPESDARTRTSTRTRTRGDSPSLIPPSSAGGLQNGEAQPPGDHRIHGNPMDEEEPDHLDVWYRLTARAPSRQVTKWLDDLASEHGTEKVQQALASVHREDPDMANLISRTRDWLWQQSHTQEKRSSKRRAQAEQEERDRIASMTPEQRQANVARVRDMMVASGLAKPTRIRDIIPDVVPGTMQERDEGSPAGNTGARPGGRSHARSSGTLSTPSSVPSSAMRAEQEDGV